MNKTKLTKQEAINAARQPVDIFDKTVVDRAYNYEKKNSKYAEAKALSLNLICLN